MDNLPDAVKKEMLSTPSGRSFPLAIAQADPEENTVMRVYEHDYKAHTEDDSAILKYFYLMCPAYYSLQLPEGKKYRVQVIDTWNMTVTDAAEEASGAIRVELPGRPYMAVLATEV